MIDPAALPGGVLAPKVVEGITFAAGPVLTQGFERGGPLRTLYASIGLPVSTHAGPQAYQVALPDRRITVHADPEATQEELRREFPREIDKVSAIVRDLRSSFAKQQGSRWAATIARRRSARTFLQDRNPSRELLAYLAVQARYFFGRSLFRLSVAELATMVAHPPMCLPQGFQGLASQLHDLFTAAGGTYLRSPGWPSFQVGRGRKASLLIGEEQVEPRAIIANMGWDTERTIFLGVRQRGLPVSMLSSVLGLASYDRPDDLFVLTVFGDAGSDTGPETTRPLTATFLGPGYAGANRDDLVDAVRTMIPFLDLHVVLRGELDLTARRILLPEEERMEHRREARNGAELRQLRAAKRFYGLQDRAHAVNRTIDAARTLAGSLS
jgi:phytoene dehydrogenase-like protein